MDLGDRVVGSMLGLALGDALGAPFEFQRANRIPHPLPVLELPWRGLPPGSTTDDTSMARNLVRSMVAADGFDPEDLVRRHLEWFASGPPDIGTLTSRVLQRVATGVAAEQAALEVWKERGPEVSAGNGSVMYCAPLGLAYAGRPEALPDLAPRLSALTHADGRCATACLAVTAAVSAVVRGTGRETAARTALHEVLPREGGEELEFLVEAAGSARPVDGPDQGFCLFTAAVGLQALAREGTFEQELLRVVGLGGDTDTNAAVAGALVGAAVGVGGIPRGWRERLGEADAIEAEAARLVPLAGAGP